MKRRQGSDRRVVASFAIAVIAGGAGLLLARLQTERTRSSQSVHEGRRYTATARARQTGGGMARHTALLKLAPTDPGPSRSEASLVPGTPGYDPARIAHFISLHELFVQEPRNEAWADPIERALPGIFVRDLDRVFPGFRLLNTECRTTTCSMKWDAPAPIRKRVEKYLADVMPGAVNETKYPYHYLALAGGRWLYQGVAQGDVAQTLATAERARQESVRNLRAGAALGPRSDIPAEQWPEK